MSRKERRLRISSKAVPTMKEALKDAAVNVMGLLTSAIAAFLLARLEVESHFALYAFTFCFVIPIGGFLSGAAASIGYFAGTRLLRHRLLCS